jgi:isopentenyl-diphosphate delta-isomerase
MNDGLEERLILVDESDDEIGIGEKSAVHLKGLLHRAFSVFVFDPHGNMLLQRRSNLKYHSPGLWSNSCCGHPRPGETTENAAHRRLREEMGFDCSLSEVFSFIYRTKIGDSLFEHEFDHVFIGNFNGLPSPTTEEVQDWKWIEIKRLERDIAKDRAKYTYWFVHSLLRVVAISAIRGFSATAKITPPTPGLRFPGSESTGRPNLR